jgi:hypothetical protein
MGTLGQWAEMKSWDMPQGGEPQNHALWKKPEVSTQDVSQSHKMTRRNSTLTVSQAEGRDGDWDQHVGSHGDTEMPFTIGGDSCLVSIY